MNIEEEIDRLRVQATVDASTIEDLTRCLEDEKNGKKLPNNFLLCAYSFSYFAD